VKLVEREEARRLRLEGWSVKTIASTVGASPSTVSRWVRDIERTSDQVVALAAANPAINGQMAGARENSRRRREERLSAQRDGRAMARRADPLHQMGRMLYWGEGSKARNKVIFTNSDLDMVRTFVRFLRESLGVEDERIRISCNCYLGNGVALPDIERYWLDLLGLPRSSMLRTIVNRPSTASQRRRRTLPHGTLRVVVHSAWLVQHIYGAIEEYAGINRPDWLDAAV
jgi:transcriptional regulator with XRE-family HTH domain